MENYLSVIPESNTQKALIVGVKNETIAIPLQSVLTIENVNTSEINYVNYENVVYHRGKVVPLVYLDKLLEMGTLSEMEKETVTVVFCVHDDVEIGIVVDQLFDQMEIESKSLGVLSDNRFFSGASILTDDVALILNVQSLVA